MNRIPRSPLALLLIVLHLVIAWLAYAALAIPPQGPWDEHTLTGIEAACFMVVAASITTLLLTAVPVAKRSLPPWWLAPPAMFLILAIARWAYIAQTYPLPPGH